MQTIVTATEPVELLALIPRLMGPVRPGSIVVVAFEGRRSRGAFRIELPAPDSAAEAEAPAHLLIGGLCRIPAATSIVAVLYPHDGASATSGPVAEAMRSFMRLATQQGFRLRDALWQGQTGWGSYLDSHSAERPIDEVLIAEARMPRMLRAADPVTEAAAHSVDDAQRAAVAAVLVAFDEEAPDDRGAACADPVALVEALLQREPEQLLAAEIAIVLVCLREPRVRDALLMQLAFGAEFADRLLGEASDQHLDEAAMRLAGASGAPEPQRLLDALALMSLVSSAVDERFAADAMTMRAWLFWALGRASDAAAQLKRVQRRSPSHTLSALLLELVDRGMLPEWLFGRG